MLDSIQHELFQQILDRFERRVDAIDAICETLDCSKDAVYRRLRSDTVLTPKELGLLAKRFSISIDKLIFTDTENVVFQLNTFERPVVSFSAYIQTLVDDLAKINSLPNVKMLYSCAEIPLFSYMFIPELFYFKMYVWGRTTWDLEFLKTNKFSWRLFSPSDRRLIEEALDHYLRIEGTELWSLNMINNTLSQIEYHLHSNGFEHSEDALFLLDKLLEWAAHLQEMAKSGIKFPIGKKPENRTVGIQAYHNEMVYTNDTALIHSDLINLVYSAFANPNFIRSDDKNISQYLEQWFQKVLSKSTNITHSNEKDRALLFTGLVRKINNTRRRCEQFLDEEV